MSVTVFDVRNQLGPEGLALLREWHNQTEDCAANSEGQLCCVEEILGDEDEAGR